MKKGIITHLLSCRPLILLGNITPYLFLIHLPVTQIKGWLTCLPENTVIITCLELAISIALAMIYAKVEPYITAKSEEILNVKRGATE